MFNHLTIEIVSFVLSALMFLLYSIWNAKKRREDPMSTIQSLNQQVRASWLEYVTSDESRSVLAVQTLRNSTMSATFLASTAVILMIASLNLLHQTEQSAKVWQVLNPVATTHRTLWVVKVLLLVSNFFVAFFSFMVSVRLYNHIGYQSSVPKAHQPASINPDLGKALIRQAASYYTVGMRAYFFAVPLVFWLFGPMLLLLASVGMMGMLHLYDRAPVLEGQPSSNEPPV